VSSFTKLRILRSDKKCYKFKHTVIRLESVIFILFQLMLKLEKFITNMDLRISLVLEVMSLKIIWFLIYWMKTQLSY